MHKRKTWRVNMSLQDLSFAEIPVLFICNKEAFGALGSFRYVVIMAKELMQQAGDLGNEIRPCSLCQRGRPWWPDWCPRLSYELGLLSFLLNLTVTWKVIVKGPKSCHVQVNNILSYGTDVPVLIKQSRILAKIMKNRHVGGWCQIWPGNSEQWCIHLFLLLQVYM